LLGRFIMARYWMKPFSLDHLAADLLPQVKAMRLSCWARLCPFSLIQYATSPITATIKSRVLLVASNSFFMMGARSLSMRRLRIFSTTIITASMNLRSFQLKSLNQDLLRRATRFNLAKDLRSGGIRSQTSVTSSFDFRSASTTSNAPLHQELNSILVFYKYIRIIKVSEHFIIFMNIRP